jgi:peptidoglycan/LPS O-acetylase OafA/YrhL
MGILRLYLAFCVAFSHFGIPLGFPTSDVAVQSFFVISGFYMALVLNEKYGPGSYWLFISNRVVRLWPTYAVVLVLSLAVAHNWQPIMSLKLPSLAYWVASQVLLVGQEMYNFLFISNNALVFTLHPIEKPELLFAFSPVPQAWTLGMEIYFYLLAPLVVRRGPVVIAAAIAGSVILRVALIWAFGFSGEPWTYRFFPSEIALFLTGSLGYFAYASRNAEQRKQVNLLLAIAASSLFASLALSKWDGVSRLASLSLLCAVIIGVPRLFELTRNIAYDRFLGELSYPLYICHFLFLWIVSPGTVGGVCLALAMSLAASIMLYRFVEAPIDSWRQNRLEKARHGIDKPVLIQAMS